MNGYLKTFKGQLLEEEPLSKYTTWNIGGVAKYFYQPKDIDDLANFFSLWPHDHKIIWLGGGSNVLISDTGTKSTVVHVRNSLNKITLSDFAGEEKCIRAEAGVSCAKLVQFCLQNNLVDEVFLAGIPGTIGGALAMNAGAFGSEIWQHVVLLETIDRTGTIKIRKPQEFSFGYRNLVGLKPDEWFTAGYFQFKHGDVREARKKIRAYWKKRLNSQPVKEHTCGSVFKNPDGHFAGHLIQDCGLKGTRIGNAKISDQHANFIINEGNATAKDIEQLIELITLRVFEKHNVKLQTEVKFIAE